MTFEAFRVKFVVFIIMAVAVNYDDTKEHSADAFMTVSCYSSISSAEVMYFLYFGSTS